MSKCTVVRVGIEKRDWSTSSKPATWMSSGTRTPWSASARRSPNARPSVKQNRASGTGLPSASQASTASAPDALFQPVRSISTGTSPASSIARR